MLDPLSALSLASAALQIIDFGCKLVSQTQEVYQSASGATKDNITLQEVVEDVSILYADLRRKDSTFHRSSADDIALGYLADESIRSARELLELLSTLKLPPGAAQWKSIGIAIRNALKKSKIQAMEKRLLSLQKQIDSRLHKMTSNQQSALCLLMNDMSKEHTRMQLESIHQMEQLKADIRQCTVQAAEDSSRTQRLIKKLESLASEGQQIANEERILKSLEFDEWRRRFNDVRKAHPQTFNWMLEDPQVQMSPHAGTRKCLHNPQRLFGISEDSQDPVPPSTGFREWLSTSQSIFWISGKPGSGKSTLMKFLSEHEKVKEYLQQWAGDTTEPIIVSWFFWAAGSPMQRSKEGLFQSLLFQIFRRCPGLLPELCADRWHDLSKYDAKKEPWSLDELDRVFDILGRQSLPGKRFCIFIDGLDEYEGLPIEIIRRLQTLAKSESIKICVASSPWNAFKTAFRDGPSIALQEYTKQDIKRFVIDILEKDDTFTRAERKDMRYRMFIDEVIKRAQGVFLWVYLVVNELLKGLSENNKLEDLKDKLEALPDTLEEYFKRIFDGIDKAHRTESAKVFLMTAHAEAPLSFICYSLLEQEHRSPGFALRITSQPRTSEESTYIYEDVSSRLNFLGKSMLEVNQINTDQKQDYQVNFIHRSVRDFLMTKDMLGILKQRATKNGQCDWNAYVALCNVQLAHAKSLGLQEGIRHSLNILFSLVDSTMFYAHEVENELKTSMTDLLDQLDDVISHYADADMAYHWTNARDRPKGANLEECNHNSFLALAVLSALGVSSIMYRHVGRARDG